MFANTRFYFWSQVPVVDTVTEPPVKSHPPVFIGDAVQPWAGETRLLKILRDAALRDLDQSEK